MSGPDPQELVELAIDTQLANVWQMISALQLDEEALPLVAGACRESYVTGYHDGDRVADFTKVSGDFDNKEIDLRVVYAFASVVESGLVGGQLMQLVVDLLRCAYCRGYLDAVDTRPFGRAPSDPYSLNLPV